MPEPIQPENLLDVLTFRIADPGTFVHRKLSISGMPLETVPRWTARAIAAGLTDGTLGYVPATRSTHLMTELLQTAIDRDKAQAERDRYKAELADARDAAYRQQQRIDAERAQWQAEIANLVNLIAPYDNEAVISIGLIRKALREGPAPVPGSSRRAQERWPDAEETARLWHNTTEKLVNPESRVPWRDMSERYRAITIEVAGKQLDWLRKRLRPEPVGESQASEPDDRRRHALVFNAISEALKRRDSWVPLSDRVACTEAVLAALDGDSGWEIPPGAHGPVPKMAQGGPRNSCGPDCSEGHTYTAGCAIKPPARAFLGERPCGNPACPCGGAQ